jgi:hypothetical protein
MLMAKDRDGISVQRLTEVDVNTLRKLTLVLCHVKTY